MTHPGQALIPIAKQQAPALVEQYRAIWSDLWNDKRVAWGVSCGEMEDVRAVLLGFLIDGVPADTAKMVALEYMKGLAR